MNKNPNLATLFATGKSPGFTWSPSSRLRWGSARTRRSSPWSTRSRRRYPIPTPTDRRGAIAQSAGKPSRARAHPAGFRELEKQATSFEAIAAGRYNYDNMTGIEKPTTVTGGLVTQDYFRVFGERALIGPHLHPRRRWRRTPSRSSFSATISGKNNSAAGRTLSANR